MKKCHSLYMLLGMMLYSLCIHTNPIYAWEKFAVDVLQENPPSNKGNADHLLPSEHIFPRDYYLIQFVELQNYSYADWLLRITLNKNKSAANVELYENIPNLNYDMRHYTRMEDFKSSSLQISLDLAKKIYEVWTNVLFETRYSKSDIGNMEGQISQFSTYIRGTGWLVGETQTGYITETPPKHLIEIAYLLKNFTSTDQRQISYMISAIDRHIDWIYQYLDKNSSK